MMVECGDSVLGVPDSSPSVGSYRQSSVRRYWSDAETCTSGLERSTRAVMLKICSLLHMYVIHVLLTLHKLGNIYRNLHFWPISHFLHHLLI